MLGQVDRQAHARQSGVQRGRGTGVLGEVQMPVGAAVRLQQAVSGDDRADRVLGEQLVEQVHRAALVALGGRLEDGAQPHPYRAQPGQVGLVGQPHPPAAPAEQGADGFDGGQPVPLPARLLGVHQAHGHVRVGGEFHG